MEFLINNEVQLHDVKEEDLSIFFEQQLNPSASYMAAFTSKNPADRNAFLNHWAKILKNQNIIKKNVVWNECVVGNVLHFEQFGNSEISYWIGKQYWSKGIATNALLQFLDYVRIRPLFARAAKDNIASIRVLEKCGFTIISEDKGFSYIRDEEIEEYILEL